MSDFDEVKSRFLAWRHVDMPCPKCKGSGVVMYGSGATWRGGMGTTSVTPGECDVCWGTGDAYRHGVDLRKMRDTEDERVAKRAGELLANAAGANFESMKPAVFEVVRELEKLARGRKQRPQWFQNCCTALANKLTKVACAKVST